VGSVWEAGKERVQRGIPKVTGSGRNRKKYTMLHNILQLNNPREAPDNKKWVGVTTASYGSSIYQLYWQDLLEVLTFSPVFLLSFYCHSLFHNLFL